MVRLKSRSKSLSQRDIKVLVLHTHAASFHKESLYLGAAAVQPALKDETMPTQLDPSAGASVYQGLNDMMLAIWSLQSLILFNNMNVKLHNSHEVSRKKRNGRGNCIHICCYLPFLQFSGFNHCLCNLCLHNVGRGGGGGGTGQGSGIKCVTVCEALFLSSNFSSHRVMSFVVCVIFFFCSDPLCEYLF